MMRGLYQHYTNIVTLGNDIGIRLRDPLTKEASYYKVDYHPHTWYSCGLREQTDSWRTLDGTPLKLRRHQSISQYHHFVDSAKNEGRIVYGTISPIQQFIAEEIPVCGLPFDALRTVFLDIEVASDKGFAPPDNPYQPVQAITAEINRHHYVWGCGDYQSFRDDVTYTQCSTEEELLTSFVMWWSTNYPDIITGWNTHTYDIPYLINRIDLLAKERRVRFTSKILSPWGKLSHRFATIMGREQKIMDVVGIPILDYLELYRKFSLVQQESYRLDAIAETELGQKKVAYDEYGSLQRLADGNPDIKDDGVYEKGSVQHAAQLRKKLAERLGRDTSAK